jgi:hypothetical protein
MQVQQLVGDAVLPPFPLLWQGRGHASEVVVGGGQTGSGV